MMMKTKQLTTVRVAEEARHKIDVYKARNKLQNHAEALNEILENAELEKEA